MCFPMACGIHLRLKSAIEFAQSHHVLLMRHSPTGMNIDVTLASLPLELEAIAHRQFFDFAGIQVAFPQLEDLVIYK